MTERKFYRADLAELLGIKVDSLNKLKLPKRDGTDIEDGKARPYWWESTALAWRAERPGRGARTDLHRSAEGDQG